ncbi:MAG TPA: TonB family protein [Terriglobales bacterium]|jgi:TonB family protein|nr:TonB family protein [Terriglobales bacterium]
MFKPTLQCRLQLILIAASSLLGRADSASDFLLTSIANRVDIASSSGKPFQLEADFTAQINVPQAGHITWKWVNKALWSQEITVGSYHQIILKKGETIYLSRNAPFTPLRVSDLLGLLTIFSSECKCWEIRRVKPQVEAGAAIECLELHKVHPQSNEWNPKRITCINPATKEVLSDEFKDDENFRHAEYSNYQPLGSLSYPMQMKLQINGSQALKVNVISLSQASFDEATFVPIPGAVARRQCENMTHPVAIKTPDPEYPRSAAQNRLGGTVTISLTVNPDGSVSNVQLLESAGHEMDSVSQQILQTWKFKPAMCGTEAVAYDIHVNVTFHARELERG